MEWWQEETAGLYNWAWVAIAVAAVVVIAVIIVIAAVSHSRRKKRRLAEQTKSVESEKDVFEEVKEVESEKSVVAETEAKVEDDEAAVAKNRQFEAELHEPHVAVSHLKEGVDRTFIVCIHDGTWVVATSGSKRVLRIFDDGDAALAFAKRLAALYKGAVVFCGEDKKSTRYRYVAKY